MIGFEIKFDDRAFMLIYNLPNSDRYLNNDWQ